MDGSFGQISSQNTDFDFAVPFNSTSLLDGTMPDLMDSTIPNSQPNDLAKSHVDLEEFIRNEQVVSWLEEVLDNVEIKFTNDDQAVEKNQEDSKESIALAETVASDDEKNDLDESFLDVDQSLSKCMKRQMNESIMSIGDPMLTGSRKLKHQLDENLSEGSGYLNETHSMSIAAHNFSLTQILENLENKDTLLIAQEALLAETKSKETLAQSYEQRISSLQSQKLDYEKTISQLEVKLDAERSFNEEVQQKWLSLEANQKNLLETVKTLQESNDQLNKLKHTLEKSLSKAQENLLAETKSKETLAQSYEQKISSLQSQKLEYEKTTSQLEVKLDAERSFNEEVQQKWLSLEANQKNLLETVKTLQESNDQLNRAKFSLEKSLSKAQENLLAETESKETLAQSYEQKISSLQSEKLEYKKTISQLEVKLDAEQSSKKEIEQKWLSLEANQKNLLKTVKTLQENNDQLNKLKHTLEKWLSKAQENLLAEAKSKATLAQSYEQKICSLQSEKLEYEKTISQHEVKLDAERSSKEEIEQKFLSLEANQKNLLETVKTLQENNDQLNKLKLTLEKSLSKAQENLLAETNDKDTRIKESKILCEKIRDSLIRTTKLQDTQQFYETLKKQQSTKISESVSACQRLIGSINKLLDQVKTEKQFQESVKSETVKKILVTIREKINNNIKELQKVQLEQVVGTAVSSAPVLTTKNPPPTAPKPVMPASFVAALRTSTRNCMSENKENA